MTTPPDLEFLETVWILLEAAGRIAVSLALAWIWRDLVYAFKQAKVPMPGNYDNA